MTGWRRIVLVGAILYIVIRTIAKIIAYVFTELTQL